jgi:sortase (surface protein transpeptidase)
MLFVLPTIAFADGLTLAVPVLGVSALVEPIGIVDGSLGTPIAPDNVGALQLPGNLLVVGHRDWSGQRRAFSRLEALQPGDVVEISDGRAYVVETTSVWDIDGEQDSWHAAVAPTDGDVLTLISCTGPFSVSRHEYLQRVVVRAARSE